MDCALNEMFISTTSKKGASAPFLRFERRIVRFTDSIKQMSIQHDNNLPLYTV
jgi:hypothetical protein